MTEPKNDRTEPMHMQPRLTKEMRDWLIQRAKRVTRPPCPLSRPSSSSVGRHALYENIGGSE